MELADEFYICFEGTKDKPTLFLSIKELSQSLESNPNATSLHANVGTLGDTSSLPRFTHLHLEFLSITTDDIVGILWALSHLRLPALICLRLVHSNMAPQLLPKNSILEFVAQSEAKLQTLTVCGAIYDSRVASVIDQYDLVAKLGGLRVFCLCNGLEDVTDEGVANILAGRQETKEKHVTFPKDLKYVFSAPKSNIAVIHIPTLALSQITSRRLYI